jgi:hypothetical protein
MSALLCIACLLQWSSSYLSGGWYAARRGGVRYDIASYRGWLFLQRAHLRYVSPEPGWKFSRGNGMRGYGPTSPTSLFEYIGLVHTVIRVPSDIEPNLIASVHAASIETTGRNVSLPCWVLALVAGYGPLRLLLRRNRKQKEQRRRGFDVGTRNL